MLPKLRKWNAARVSFLTKSVYRDDPKRIKRLRRVITVGPTLNSTRFADHTVLMTNPERKTERTFKQGNFLQ